MPQISISVSQTGQFLSYDISFDLTVDNLKEFIAAETGIESSQQRLILNGRPLDDGSQTLQAAGVQNDDMLALAPRGPPPRQPQSRPPQQQTTQGQGQGQVQEPQLQQIYQEAERMRQDLLNNPQRRQQAASQVPRLAEAVNDQNRFRQAYLDVLREQQQNERQRQAELLALDGDVNEENQAKIAEHIRQQEIEKDIELAMEESPELYGRVTMLYIDVLVNNHPVKAFVDSGAQMTIMSPSCAEACGLTHKIDNRIVGIAKGVGTAKILGRIHRALVQFGDAELPCAFTVMEGKDVDMLLGLDMLKRYQASIDLQQNKLVFSGNVAVPFLPESEIPKYASEGGDNESNASGPSVVSSSSQAGAAKPSGSAQTPASQGSTQSNFQGQGRSIGVASSAPTPQSARQPAQSNPSYPENDIQALERLGADRQQAIELLRACDGNAEAAAAVLFDQQF